MASKKKTPGIQGVPSALSNEVRAAGHASAADKLEIQNALARVPESGQHTELTDEEIAAQEASVLDFPDEIKAVQQVEYGTFVAAEDIFHLGALAYAVGNPVPVSNVEKHGYEEIGAVRRVAKPTPPSTVEEEEAGDVDVEEGA